MTTIEQIRLVTLFTMVFVMLLSEFTFAMESSLAVELPKRINARIHKILETQRMAEVESKQIERRIKQIVEQINQTENKEEIYRLQKHYIDMRAQALEIIARKIVTIEGDLSAISRDMSRFEELQKDSDRFGIGQGIDRNDPQVKQAIQETFQGYGKLLDMVEQLDPKANVQNIRTSLNTMDEVAMRFFHGSGDATLQEQQKFIKEAMVASRAVQRFIGIERDYLMRKLYYVDARNMIRQFGQLNDTLFAGFDVPTMFNNLHRQDDKVFEAGNDPIPGMVRRTSGHRQLGVWN